MDYQSTPSGTTVQYHGASSKIRTSLTCAVFTHIVLFVTIFLAFIYVFNWPCPVKTALENYKFQWHPVLMISAFVLFMGEAILAYRLMPFEHGTQKVIHLVLQTFALVTMIISIWMIVTFHTVNNGAHIYNAHGITGIATFALFCVQYVIGVIAFFFPRLPDGPRAAVMPYHKYIGMCLFLMAWMAMLSGLMDRERIQFKTGDEFNPIYRLGNTLGAFIVLSGACILFHFGPVAQKENAPDSERLL